MFSQAPLHVSHSTSSHLWGSCVIYSMWACGCDYTVWIIRRITASRNYSMTVRWVTLDKTAFLPTLHAEQKPLQSFYSYSDGAIGHWLLSCNLFRRIGATIGSCSLYCFLILSSKICSPLPMSRHEKHPILYDIYVQLHVSKSSVISDPVILIAPKHKAGKIG